MPYCDTTTQTRYATDTSAMADVKRSLSSVGRKASGMIRTAEMPIHSCGATRAESASCPTKNLTTSTM